MRRLKHTSFCIAGLVLTISHPEAFALPDALPSFHPFLMDVDEKIPSACSITLLYATPCVLDDSATLLSDISPEWAEQFHLYKQHSRYIAILKTNSSDNIWQMESDLNFGRSVIYMQNNDQFVPAILSWLVMVIFGQACLSHRTILIHASVIKCGQNAYAFLGKSGTGKSTHSKLWLDYIENTELVNDDNPALRIEDGQSYIYGTPWSGKTACYKNIKIRLQAFVRLKQASSNSFFLQNNSAAFMSVLPSCTALRWDQNLFMLMTETLATIIEKTAVNELNCLPNQEAAILCFRKLNNIA